MRWLSLFSGAGFHDYGIRAAGCQIVGQVEWDAYCTEVLKQRFGDIPRWSDVRECSVESVRERYGRIDAITGGFSCRDISVAGKQGGIARDTESGITWRNMFRLIRGLRPRWVLIENVPALRTVAADRVLASLERIGYACWPVVVGAWAVGAPHKRDRVWIVGMYNGGAAGHLADAHGKRVRDSNELRGFERSGRTGATVAGGGSVGELAHAGSTGLEERRGSTGGAGPELALPAGGGGLRWPSRPGESQHEWEEPRLANATGGEAKRRFTRQRASGSEEQGRPQPSLGVPATGNAGRLARPTAANARAIVAGSEDALAGEEIDWLAAFQRKHALKAAGNGNPWCVPFLIACWIRAQHEAEEGLTPSSKASKQ